MTTRPEGASVAAVAELAGKAPTPDTRGSAEAPACAASPSAMRLLVMAHFVYRGRVGGAEPMLYNLLHGLARHSTRLSIACADRGNLDAAFAAAIASEPAVRLVEAGGGGPRFLAEQRACLEIADQADAVLFPNYFVPPVIPRRLGRVGVVLHDMQYRHFPQHFSRRKRAWLATAQRFALHRADRVITISEFVRDDVLRTFGRHAERKLIAIPNPISWERFGTDRSVSPPLAEPYILTVAAQYPHKNLETLIRAFAVLAREEKQVRLVLIGRDYNSLHGVLGKRPSLLALVDELDIGPRVHLTGYLDDRALGAWYRGAALFAFPSVFEGFGMPPVEAIGFGLPTVTTRCTSLPEATMGLATYVDAHYDVAEWADRLREVLLSPQRHRPTPADAARVRAHYSDDRIADLYSRALAS